MAPSQRPSQPFISMCNILPSGNHTLRRCSTRLWNCEGSVCVDSISNAKSKRWRAHRDRWKERHGNEFLASVPRLPAVTCVCARSPLTERERERESGGRRVGVGRWQADDEQGRGAVGAAGTLLKHRGDSHKRGSYWWTQSRLLEGGREPRRARCLVAGRNR